MRVKNVPIATIKPYWRNANIGDVEQVKMSIQAFGMNQPIVVDRDNVIIVGHTRYTALLQLGWKTAPVTVSDLPPDKVKAYRIADNKTRDGARWDRDLLVSEILQISGTVDMQPYFPDEDLSAVVRQVETSHVPDAAEISRAQQRLETQFEGLDKAPEIELACPHCGETLYVKRKDLITRGS